MVLSVGKSFMAFVLVAAFPTGFTDPVGVASLAGVVVVSDLGMVGRVGGRHALKRFITFENDWTSGNQNRAVLGYLVGLKWLIDVLYHGVLSHGSQIVFALFIRVFHKWS